MTAIVYLDVDDEITSAASRLRNLADDRIVLVLPVGSRLGTSRINFRLLARETTTRNKTLEIVTGDASTRALAASAGLITHPSVAAFEGRQEAGAPFAGIPPIAPAPTSGGATPTVASGTRGAIASQHGIRRGDDSPTAVVPVPDRLPSLSLPRALAPVPQVGRRQAGRSVGRREAVVLAVVVALLIGGLAGYAWLPSATVTLTPAVEQLGPIKLTVTAQSGITKPDPTNLLVPAQTFSFDLDISDTFPATGVKVDETAASGAVTFTNCDIYSSVDVPAGSQVSTTGGIVFATQTNVRLKKANFGGGGINCSNDGTQVVAVVPGEGGNVGAGTITKVPPGYPSNYLFVTNPTATTGGTHTETRQVAQADIDAAMTTLNEKLTTAFDDKVAAAEGVPEGMTLFPETKALGVAIPSVDPKTLLDTVGDTFGLGLTAKGTVVGADSSPVSILADARIRSTVEDGFVLVEDSIKIEIGAPLVIGSTISFPVTATAAATREVDLSALRSRIRGLGLPQARTVLAAFGVARITVWPEWVTAIPTNDDRLSVTIVAPSPTPGPGASGSAAPAASGATP